MVTLWGVHEEVKKQKDGIRFLMRVLWVSSKKVQGKVKKEEAELFLPILDSYKLREN